MLELITLVIFLGIAILAAGLRPVYAGVPIKELRRRASRGDQAAHLLYQVSHHGMTAEAVLVLISLVSVSMCCVIFVGTLGAPLATLFVMATIFLIFFLIPTKQYRFAHKLARPISPYFARILIKIRPITNHIARIVRRYRPHAVQTGVYTKQDIIQLFEDQKISAGNQIDNTELDIALHALTFGDKKVSEVMTPRRVVHFVQAEEPIGPVLINELHESGFSRFPVRKEADNNIVGTLFLRDLVERKHGGIVSNAMNSKVYYVNDQEKLIHVLKAFIRTKHHLFMVVNEFEDIVGIITIEDILEQILGRKIVDEFDRYADLRAVAKKLSPNEGEHI